jgi:hypothetical protein
MFCDDMYCWPSSSSSSSTLIFTTFSLFSFFSRCPSPSFDLTMNRKISITFNLLWMENDVQLALQKKKSYFQHPAKSCSQYLFTVEPVHLKLYNSKFCNILHFSLNKFTWLFRIRTTANGKWCTTYTAKEKVTLPTSCTIMLPISIYSKTWFIWNSIIWNFVILWISDWTNLPAYFEKLDNS